MKIKIVPVSDLIPDPENARRHSDRNLDTIAKSLAEFGQRKPIVITSGKVVLAGNGTLEASKRLGWEKIAAITVPDTWTPDQARAFALADNRTAELAKWNAPLLAAQLESLGEIGFTSEVLGFNLAEEPDVRQEPTREVNVDDFDFEHRCPECGFEFDGR